MYCLGWADCSEWLHEAPGELPGPRVELAALAFLSNGKAIKSVLWTELGPPTPAMTIVPLPFPPPWPRASTSPAAVVWEVRTYSKHSPLCRFFPRGCRLLPQHPQKVGLEEAWAGPPRVAVGMLCVCPRGGESVELLDALLLLEGLWLSEGDGM